MSPWHSTINRELLHQYYYIHYIKKWHLFETLATLLGSIVRVRMRSIVSDPLSGAQVYSKRKRSTFVSPSCLLTHSSLFLLLFSLLCKCVGGRKATAPIFLAKIESLKQDLYGDDVCSRLSSWWSVRITIHERFHPVVYGYKKSCQLWIFSFLQTGYFLVSFCYRAVFHIVERRPTMFIHLRRSNEWVVSCPSITR